MKEYKIEDEDEDCNWPQTVQLIPGEEESAGIQKAERDRGRNAKIHLGTLEEERRTSR